MDLNTVRNIIGIIGNIISFGLFLSPAQVFYKIIKRNDVEEFSPNPYLATLLNCAMWVFYGIVRPHSTLVWTINGIGLLIESTYITIYFIYANNKKRRYVLLVLLLEALFLAGIAGLTLGVAHTLARRILVLGIICVVLNIMMYAMPLDVMWLVIRTKSIEYLPVYLSFCNLLNGATWLSYARLVHTDLFLTISNGSGACLGLIQVLLIAIYYRSTPKRDDQKKPSELPLSTTVGVKSPV